VKVLTIRPKYTGVLRGQAEALVWTMQVSDLFHVLAFVIC